MIVLLIATCSAFFVGGLWGALKYHTTVPNAPSLYGTHYYVQL